MRILSIDGGGYLGLATAAFVEGVEHHFRTRLSDRFDMFCGTSTGALIALALAAGKTGPDVTAMYTTLGQTVFRRRTSSIAPFVPKRLRAVLKASQLVRPLYHSEPLRDALEAVFGDMTLGDIQARGKLALVPSYCVSSGTPRVFKTDHGGLSLHSGYRLVDVALASAAAPTYFSLVRIKKPVGTASEVFCDGGVVANQPALMGFVEAISQLRVPVNQVHLLSLSTPRADLSAREPIEERRGVLGWWRTLVPAFIDGGALISSEVLKRLVNSYPADARPLYVRIKLQNRHCLDFDDVSAEAMEALLQEGSNEASQASTREALAPFFV